MLSLVFIPTVQTQIHSAVLLLKSLCSSPTNKPIATLVLSLRSATEIHLAGVVRDGNTAENYGLLSNFPWDYLLTQLNIKLDLKREGSKYLD